MSRVSQPQLLQRLFSYLSRPPWSWSSTYSLPLPYCGGKLVFVSGCCSLNWEIICITASGCDLVSAYVSSGLHHSHMIFHFVYSRCLDDGLFCRCVSCRRQRQRSWCCSLTRVAQHHVCQPSKTVFCPNNYSWRRKGKYSWRRKGKFLLKKKKIKEGTDEKLHFGRRTT